MKAKCKNFNISTHQYCAEVAANVFSAYKRIKKKKQTVGFLVQVEMGIFAQDYYKRWDYPLKYL
jgi:hypothetical protein